MKAKINIVWLKRDLRLTDHQPLKKAQDSGLPVVLLYIFEPILINDSYYSERHWRFVTQSLTDMNKSLPGKVVVAHADAVDVFNELARNFDIQALFSHQETGLGVTFSRDKAVARWAKQNKVDWQETPKDAVIRPCSNRGSWDKHWQSTMGAELVVNQIEKLNTVSFIFDTSGLPHQWKQTDPIMQQGGATQAKTVLDDFFNTRGVDYHRLISKPLQSQLSCSRMSPYLAWGNISLREMYQELLNHWSRKGWRRALVALASRLHWHCHFIQKFESECGMEHEPINQGYQTMPYRDDEHSERDLVAWQTGHTGYPLVDACMRCLIKTGYINFRMRAMLVSFLSHHLQIDWRRGVAHLARVFLDFEPGIHYAQFQMQAGVTGINTIRIYNPTKQAQEHDPDAVFIQQWCPELASLTPQLMFEPWAITPMDELMYDIIIGEHYPSPIVDTKETYRQASERLWSWRKRPDVKKEAHRILQRHVRNS